MNDPKTALVLGATGLVGHYLVNELLMDLTYQKIRLLNRRPSGFTDPRIEEHVLDLTSLPESSEWFVADDLFIAFGTTIKKAGSQERFQEIDLDIPLSVALRAHDAGTDHCILVSSVGADASSSIFYNRVKGQLENSLKDAGFESIQIFRPSLLLGNRQEFRLGERMAIFLVSLFSSIKDDLFGRYSPMPVTMLAKGMVNAARMGLDGHQIYHYREIKNLSRKKL